MAFHPLVAEDILIERCLRVGQRTTDVHRQRQTDVAVYLRTLVEHRHTHVLKADDKTVVASQLGVHPPDILLEGRRLPLEVPELLRSLMTGVGEVEDVVGFLRVEHQRILIAALHRLHKLTPCTLLLLLGSLDVAFLLGVYLLELRTQNSERLLQVTLFQHCMGRQQRQRDGHQQQYPFPYHIPIYIITPAKVRLSE